MAQESPKARAARLAERKRVNDKYAKGQAERAAAKRPAKQKQYPYAIQAMGQGFKNLYDTLQNR